MAGRPKAWDNIIKPNLEQIKQWKSDGRTNKQIAELLNIGYTTLTDNQSRYTELKDILKAGTSSLVENLEKSLFQIAMGGFTSKKITRKYVEINGVIQDGIVEITETIQEHTPNMAALAFSLKNLASTKWQDKVNHSIDNEDMSNAVKEFLKVGRK